MAGLPGVAKLNGNRLTITDPHLHMFFAGAYSNGVRQKGFVSADSAGVEVSLESADTRMSRKC